MNLQNILYMAQESFQLASHGFSNMPKCEVFTVTRTALQTVLRFLYCQSKQRLDFTPIGRHLLPKFVGHFVPIGKRDFSIVVATMALSMLDLESLEMRVFRI